MSEEEFAAWSDRLRASARGPDQATLVERLIAARNGDKAIQARLAESRSDETWVRSL
jgi:hypothetical protein